MLSLYGFTKVYSLIQIKYILVVTEYTRENILHVKNIIILHSAIENEIEIII